MIQLARIFSDGAIFQRNTPIVIWGESDIDDKITVKVNSGLVGEYEIGKGQFTLSLPPQKELQNAMLQIGDVVLKNVDFGEVWLAAGQSNMELEYEFTSDKDETPAQDEHLRMYTVGKYSFANERELRDKEWEPWDRWYSAADNNEQNFSAVGYHFAKKLREGGVPVGIINASWGGTSASAWIDRKLLEADTELNAYVKDFEELKAALNMDVFRTVKMRMRAHDTDPAASRAMKEMLVGKTLHPKERMKQMQKNGGGMPGFPKELSSAPIDFNRLLAWGPGDPNEPGALYDYMVQEFMGYSVKGVIYYQGESDDHKAAIYDKLFSTLVNSWRGEWQSKNAAQKKLPFVVTQLAPFGMWMTSNGKQYPILRANQEKVAASLSDVYLASTSDAGNVFDIHPKNKVPVGTRLALLAEKHVYGKAITADAPKAVKLNVNHVEECLEVEFANGEGLYVKEQSDAEYNGFSVDTIMPEFLPGVLDGVNGLEVIADGKTIKNGTCEINNDKLVIKSAGLAGAKDVKVKFAQTAFYQVNLYNKADIPAVPFELQALLD